MAAPRIGRDEISEKDVPRPVADEDNYDRAGITGKPVPPAEPSFDPIAPRKPGEPRTNLRG